MSCDEVKELLASFAIGALDEDERAEVDEHLHECRLHDNALASLRSVVDALPLTVEERDPPPELRERILRGAESIDRDPAEPVPIARAPKRRPSFNMGWALAAAAVVIAGLFAWNVVLQTSDDGESNQLVRDWSGDTGSARMVYLPDEDLAVMSLDLAPPPTGRVYQAWKMRGAAVESLGVVPESGDGVYSDIADADAVAVSIEPPGGSEQPTTQPVLVMSLE
jgi:anti-sigma-K factor RskA